MCIPQFVYSFVSWWTFGLFLSFGYCKMVLLWRWEYQFSTGGGGMYLEMKLLRYMVILYLTFWATAKLFFEVAEPFYNPTSNVGGLQFIHIFTNACCFPFFFLNCIHPNASMDPLHKLSKTFHWMPTQEIIKRQYYLRTRSRVSETDAVLCA